MKLKQTMAIMLLLGLCSVEGGRLLVRDDDPDEIELNGTAMKDSKDVNVYSKTFLTEGKSITKINQEEEDRKNGDAVDPAKTVDEITQQVKMQKIQKPTMIEMASYNTPSPTHFEIEVPREPTKPKRKQEVMTREEIANTIMWARKDEIDQANLPKKAEFNIQTAKMSKSEKSDLLHQVVNSAEQDIAETADPSLVPVSAQQIEQDRMKQAEQVDQQVQDLEDMQFKADDLKQFTSRNQQNSMTFQEVKVNRK